jgi:hypothetical protein
MALLAMCVAMAIVLTVWSMSPPHGSQQSPPDHRSLPAKSEQQDRIGTQSPGANGQQHDDKRGNESKWYGTFLNHPTEWLLALFTAILAVYTACLFYATSGLVEAAREQSRDMKASIAVSAEAADAAKKTAQVTAAAERPHILLTELKIVGLRQPPDAEGNVEVKCTYQFQNFGKSPAFLKDACVRFNWANLPPNPSYPSLNRVPHIIAPVTGIYYTRPVGVVVPHAICEDVAADRLPVHVYGLLTYEDVLGTLHTLRYCYRLAFEGNDASVMFRPGGPSTYWEYT